MKRKGLILIAAAMVFLSAAAIGTVAYFTATGTAVNTITAGNVRMLLHDENPDGAAFPQDGMSGLMPGDTVDKVVYVENTGDHAFYTRIKLKNAIASEEGVLLSIDKIRLNIDETYWKLGTDGWYYCLSPVEQGGKTVPLFTQVAFASDMSNDYMSAEVTIEVVAQAVQKANNGDTVWQAAGWPME
jgi:predicted ribosomally synthesized peptide with SipW-like signal peptide